METTASLKSVASTDGQQKQKKKDLVVKSRKLGNQRSSQDEDEASAPQPDEVVAGPPATGVDAEQAQEQSNVIEAAKIGRMEVEDKDEAEADGPPKGFEEFEDRKYSVTVDVEKAASADGLSYWARIRSHLMTYVSRVHTIRIYEIALLHWEMTSLVNEAKIFIAGAQVLCWRRTTCEVATFFQLCTFAFSVVSLVRAASGDYEDFGNGKVFGMEVGDYAEHFKGYVALEYVYSCSIVFAQGLAFACAFLGSWHWRTFMTSSRYNGYGYVVVYFMPFVMLLCLPFQDGVDIRGIQQKFCRDIVDGAQNRINISSSWAPQQLLNTMSQSQVLGTGAASAPLLGLNSTIGLRTLLRDNFSVALPEDFCKLDPEEWSAAVEAALEKTGRLIKDGQDTCSAVNITTGMANATASAMAAGTSAANTAGAALKDLTQDRVAAIAKCQEPTCATCGAASCITLLPTLQTSAALAMSSSRAQAILDSGATVPKTSQEALKVMGLQEAATSLSSCAVCLDELQGAAASASTGQIPTCASLCMPLWAEGVVSYSGAATVQVDAVKRLNASFTSALASTAFAVRAADSAQVLQVCVKAEDLDLVKALMSLATATRPWALLIGMRLSLRALSVLLPTNYAMMLGSFKGACVAKTILPYSRVPGLIMICAVVFTLPHLLTLLVAVKSIVGDWTMTVSILCFLGTQVVFLPWKFIFGDCVGNGVLEPATHEQATQTMEKRQYISLFFQIGMVVFMCIFLLMSEHLWNFLSLGLIEVDFKSFRAQFFSREFWSFAGWTAINLFCKMYGITRISSIFFADACLIAILVVDEEDADPKDQAFRDEHGKKEHYLFVELHKALDPDLKNSQVTEGAPLLKEEDPDKSSDAGGASVCSSLVWQSKKRPVELIDTE